MKCKRIMAFLVVFGMMSCRVVFADESPKTVEHLYPNLAAGVLTYAKVAKLPEGILLKSEGVEISLSEIKRTVAEQPSNVRTMFEKNLFFFLEQESARKLLVHIARKGIDVKSDTVDVAGDDQLIGAFIDKLTKEIAATDEEQREFFVSNPQFFRGASFDNAQPQIAHYLAGQKKQYFVEDYIRTLGQKMTIEVSDEWTRQQAALAKDNPLDKARQNGKFTVALFNATTPCCPDKLGPVIAAIGKQFGSRLNTVSLNPNTEPILAARYRVRGNPFLIFYDAEGKEVFREQGEMTHEDIVTKLAEIGLK